MIDDVQFFVGKRATVVELQHTIDTLLREGRQLVLASDRPPPELAGLGAELVARMSGGLVCGIERPERETRLRILRQLASAGGMAVPVDVLDFVAAELDGDARQLAGALNRLEATSRAMGQPVTPELAQTALADIIRATERVVRLSDIERAVCDVFGLERRVLQSNRKTRAVSHPRMLAMWLARKYTRAAFSEIGRFFGNRTHSTVISAEKKVDRWMANKASIQFAHGSCDVAAAVHRVEVRLRSG
jgi:chromosomal replication initiator protein